MTPPGKAGQLWESTPPGARGDLYGFAGSARYDAITRDDGSEIADVLRFLAATPGPVLELCAGSGRLTLPVLAAGRDITAVDLSPAMLRLLAERVAASPALVRRRDKLCIVLGNALRPQRGEASCGAVLMPTASVTLFDAEERALLLRSVRTQLAPGGAAWISTLDIDLGGASAPYETVTPVVGPGRAEIHEHVDPTAGHRHVTLVEFDDDDRPTHAYTSRTSLVSARGLREQAASAGLVPLVEHRRRVPGEPARQLVALCLTKEGQP